MSSIHTLAGARRRPGVGPWARGAHGIGSAIALVCLAMCAGGSLAAEPDEEEGAPPAEAVEGEVTPDPEAEGEVRPGETEAREETRGRAARRSDEVGPWTYPFRFRPGPPRETLPGMYPENIGRFSDKGIYLASSDRRYVFRVSGFVHLDSRFTTDLEGEDATASLFWRRTRITLDGRFLGNFEYRLMWDNIVDPLNPFDFHIDWRPIHEFNVRVGGFKSPFGLERRWRSFALLFVNRSLPNALSPNRDIGLFVYGQTQTGFFSYEGALVTGAANLETFYRFTPHPDFAGRVYFLPFRLGEHHDALHNLGFGASWTIGNEFGDADDRRLGVVRGVTRRMLFDYSRGDDPVVAHGIRDRQSVQIHWSHKQGQVFAEFNRAAHRLARGFDADGQPLASAYLANYGWHLTGSFTFVKGDKNGFYGVKPSQPFKPREGQFGGVTGSLRYQEIYFDPGSFPVFADEESSVRAARAVGTSWQWHINSLLEVHADAEFTIPQGGGPNGSHMTPDFLFSTRLEARY